MSDFVSGVRDALPITAGYLPIALAFGSISTSLGIPPTSSILMSILVYAGASQFIAVNLMSIGASAVEVILATLFVNLRHILMSATLSPRLKGVNAKLKAILAYGVTDETFAVAVSESRILERASSYLLGLNLSSFLSWVAGTALGSVFAVSIPKFLMSTLPFALTAFFIALLVISTSDKVSMFVAAVSFVITPVFTYLLGTLAIITVIVLGSMIGVVMEKLTTQR